MIESYRFGRILINGKWYHSDLIMGYEGYIDDRWWRRKSHKINFNDIEKYIEKINPSVIIIGRGYFGFMSIDGSIVDFCIEHHIQLIDGLTSSMVEVVNRYIMDGGAWMAAFHVSC